MKKLILMVILCSVITSFAFAHSHVPKEPRIVLVLDNVKGSIARNVYKHLSWGLKAQDIDDAKILFKKYSQLNAKIFKQYDVVIAISTKQKGVLDPKLLPFVKTHAKKRNLITVALLPGKDPVKLKTPKGVDALSSSSQKIFAVNFVRKVLAKKVADLL